MPGACDPRPALSHGTRTHVGLYPRAPILHKFAGERAAFRMGARASLSRASGRARRPRAARAPCSCGLGGVGNTKVVCAEARRARLAAEAVERAALALERVHDVHRRDGLAARVLRVRDRVADDVLEEHLEHAARLLVDEARDALDAAAAREAADRRLGDALDVVAQDLAVALRAALAEALAALAASRHDCERSV